MKTTEENKGFEGIEEYVKNLLEKNTQELIEKINYDNLDSLNKISIMEILAKKDSSIINIKDFVVILKGIRIGDQSEIADCIDELFFKEKEK